MKIALLGDVALFGCNKASNSKYKEKFAPVRKLLVKCDYVICNLETPLTNCEKTIGGKSAYIKGSPEDIEILKYLGITHVSLANNHTFDYRLPGLEETIKTLDNAGIDWYGVKEKECTIQDSWNKVVLLGYCCYSTNAKGMGVINELDPHKIEKRLNTIRDAIPIVSLHWGQEHVHYPNYDHVEVARKLSNSRKLIIHGHHPHVLQGIEMIEQSLVMYSLGNFCFDDVYTNKSREPLIKLSRGNQEALIVVLEIEENNIINYIYYSFSFDKEKYAEKDIKEEMKEWTAFLYTPKSEFNKTRSSELNAYLTKRKEARDLNWYLKRLNYNSIKMITASRKNKMRYDALIGNYIKDQRSEKQ